MPAQLTPQKGLDVAIVGGGIGGICTALGLLRNPNINVHVYEAWADFGDIGAGVAFGPNASRALEMISPKAYEIFWHLATPNMTPGNEDVFFEVIAGEGPQAGKTILTMRNETGQRTFHRARILEALGGLVPPDNCHFNKRVIALSNSDNDLGRTILHFDDESTAEADCVVGADGIHSRTRRHVFGHAWQLYEPRFTGAAGYRCLAPMQKAKEMLGDDAGKSLWVWGRSGPLTLYPIDGGKTLNLVGACTSFDSWDGPWVRPTKRGETTEAYGTYTDPLSSKVLSLMESLEPKVFSLWDLPPLPTYIKDNVVLIGDAAHASTPFQASGAGQAVEDALILCRVLDQVKTVSDLPAALHAYDQVRRPRANKCAQTSLEAGELNSMRLPGVMDDVEEYIKCQGERLGWIWNVDHKEEIRQAETVFRAGIGA